MRLDFYGVDVSASSVDDCDVSAFEGSDWPGGSRWAWSVANVGDAPVTLRSVSLVFRVIDVAGPVRLLRNGYQSWSHTGAATLGVDEDPSRHPAATIDLLRASMHADPATTAPGELRSELVCVLDDGTGPELVGFDGGDRHDGTVRLRLADDGELEVRAEAFLGGAVLAPGERRELHGVVRDGGDGPSPMLERWAAEVGRRNGARVGAPYQVGWCSWYHYFHDVTEAALRANLALAGDWPFDVFQLDDGYQAAIGDWLDTNERFPTPLDGIAAAIAGAGVTPGLWIAPFIVAPDSRVATEHPEWLAQTDDGSGPLPGMFNPSWGGGLGGLMYALDTTLPEVQAHLEAVAAGLVARGFPYLKLDFTFAPSFPGRWHDAAATPAERVRLGYDAIRRGAGESTFLLGCGAPLGPVIGVVDGNRIGPDVDPGWHVDPARHDYEVMAPWRATQPSTANAWRNTAARSFLHRRLWLNDPDCVMLRTSETRMAPEAARAWAWAVGVSGGMALVSDDLALLDADARRLFDEVIEVGRASDAEAARDGGHPARCADLLEHPVPFRLEAAGWAVDIDPDTGEGTLQPS